MSKKYKRIFGILGLILVAIITAIAASLPSSEVQASETSVTDTINVRVVGSTPNVTLSNIITDDITVKPHESFKVTYENVNDIAVKLNRTDANGITTTYLIEQWQANYYPGEKSYTLDLDSYYTTSEQSNASNSLVASYQLGKRIHAASLTSNSNSNIQNLGAYGYGDFVVYVEAFGTDSVKAEDSVPFHYYPVIGSISTNDDSGFAIINLDYLPDSDPEGHVNRIAVNMYNSDNILVWSTSVKEPQKTVTLPDLEDGLYHIELIAYDQSGAQLFRGFPLKIKYENQTPIPVPDTGSFTQGINLARTDYLITGLIIFGIITVAGLITLKKLNPNKARAHVNTKRRRIKK